MAKAKTQVRKAVSQNKITNLFLVLAAGGLLGATAGILLAPKKSRSLCDNLCDTYDDLSDKGHEVAENLMDKGQEYVDNIRDTAHHYIGCEEPTSNTNMVVGLVGGALLGAAAVYLLTRDSDEEEGLAHKFKAAGKSAAENLQSMDWMETAKDVIETIAEKATGGQSNGRGKHAQSNLNGNLNEVLKWANMGLSVWQNLQKRS